MSGLCKDCQFWDHKAMWTYNKQGKPFEEHKPCTHPRFVFFENPSTKTYLDGLNYFEIGEELHEPGFSTGPDFGCIHWKQRPPEPGDEPA